MSLDNFDKNKNLGNVRPPRKLDDNFDLDKSKIEVEKQKDASEYIEKSARRVLEDDKIYERERRDDSYDRKSSNQPRPSQYRDDIQGRDFDYKKPSKRGKTLNVTDIYNEMEKDSLKDREGAIVRKSDYDNKPRKSSDGQRPRDYYSDVKLSSKHRERDERRRSYDDYEYIDFDAKYKNQKHSKKKKSKKGIIAFAILEIFTLIAIAGVGYITRINNLSQKIEFDKKEVRNTNIDSVKLETMKGYFTIAIFGVDSRTGDVGKGNNSDINIIANVNVETGDIKLVSVYRDTFLNITDGGSYGKMNAAYMYGGPVGAVKALNKNLDLNIENYVTFNWKAVANAIDLLGGIDIEITRAEFRYMNSFIHETCRSTGIFYDNPAAMYIHSYGPLHLNGVQAVAYGRLRLMDSDFQRVDRQRRVIIECLKAAKKMSFVQLSAILDMVLPQIAYDFDMSQVLTLARNISGFNVSETIGFPTNFSQQEMGKSGDCIIPKTLAGNVTKLHSTVFNDEGYSPSSAVHTYSNRIVALTGQYALEAENSKTSQETSASAVTNQSSTTGNRSQSQNSSQNSAPYQSGNSTNTNNSSNVSEVSTPGEELSDAVPILSETNSNDVTPVIPGGGTNQSSTNQTANNQSNSNQAGANQTSNNNSPARSGEGMSPGMSGGGQVYPGSSSPGSSAPGSPVQGNRNNTSNSVPISPGGNSAPISPSNPPGSSSQNSQSNSASPMPIISETTASRQSALPQGGVAIPYPGAAVPVQSPGSTG